MQATIQAVSSILDNDTVLIETHLTIGDSTTSQRCGYSLFELNESRYLSGTQEERIETLRLSAQAAAESLAAQVATLMAHIQATPPAIVKGADSVLSMVREIDQSAVDAQTLEAEKFLEGGPKEPAVKKTRRPRTTKTQTESQE